MKNKVLPIEETACVVKKKKRERERKREINSFALLRLTVNEGDMSVVRDWHQSHIT